MFIRASALCRFLLNRQMNTYAWFKQVHVMAVSVSLSVFVLRAYLVLTRSPWAERKWLAYGSHAIDTLLLLSAFTLVWLAELQPFHEDWLRHKLMWVLVYIVCGALALKRAPTWRLKILFFVFSLLVVSQVIVIALSKNAQGWLIRL